jgi:hypothetical protein
MLMKLWHSLQPFNLSQTGHLRTLFSVDAPLRRGLQGAREDENRHHDRHPDRHRRPHRRRAASAQLQRIPDTSYIQAARCEGLAKGAQQPDEALTAFVKAAERFRSPAVRDRGDQAFIDGKRAAVHDKEKAQAELAGGCQALRNPGTALPAN